MRRLNKVLLIDQAEKTRKENEAESMWLFIKLEAQLSELPQEHRDGYFS